ncbi:hypothetical protein [Paenibacillus bovis]|uniref:Uncharacterized protein n=1 Tax=Paenibacillus bovis TaxID=1616788 RepID=A0A1X9T4F6_9BACL|nr:hypothetical protein [Paenibacillus bovis]ARR10712.1 hypothetical protein AR543_p0104 [Paenibacillus bovis]
MEKQKISHMSIVIRTWKCSCCSQSFYEMHQFEISQCPSCSCDLTVQAPEQLDENEQYELQVDPTTAEVSIINTKTGEKVVAAT